MRSVAILAPLAILAGCSLLYPEDPREGSESQDDCAARVAALLGPTTSYADFTEPMGVPTYTFDITKMTLEAIQDLIVYGSDETAGSRGMVSTNETSTAVDQFMSQSVDEKGAFFFGRDPALYRVRGKPQPKEDMIASGCARQQTDMRLIMIDVAPTASEPEPQDTSENTNENNA